MCIYICSQITAASDWPRLFLHPRCFCLVYKATLLAVVDLQYTLSYCTVVSSRVESGSDDPDYLGHLGHFFGGSSGSHPQTKLSECDLDITCSLENNAGIW